MGRRTRESSVAILVMSREAVKILLAPPIKPVQFPHVHSIMKDVLCGKVINAVWRDNCAERGVLDARRLKNQLVFPKEQAPFNITQYRLIEILVEVTPCFGPPDQVTASKPESIS